MAAELGLRVLKLHQSVSGLALEAWETAASPLSNILGRDWQLHGNHFHHPLRFPVPFGLTTSLRPFFSALSSQLS